MAAIAQQRECVEEPVRRAGYQLDVRFQLGCIVNEFGKPEIADEKPK
jgi:hypothetical protein